MVGDLDPRTLVSTTHVSGNDCAGFFVRRVVYTVDFNTVKRTVFVCINIV